MLGNGDETGNRHLVFLAQVDVFKRNARATCVAAQLLDVSA